MKHDLFPHWMICLDDDDLCFVKQFILASGSLKGLANCYGVSYPTVRLRLDRIIQKISLYDEHDNNAYVSLIKDLALDGKIEASAAKLLMSAYRKEIQVEVLN